MSLKYKIQRLRVKLRSAKKDLGLDEIQKEGYDIVIQMINDQNSELLYDFTNGRRGIENGELFIEIKGHKISITNSVSHDDVPIDDRIHDDLVNKFNAKMTRKFNAKESKFKNKTKNRLETIKSEIKK